MDEAQGTLLLMTDARASAPLPRLAAVAALLLAFVFGLAGSAPAIAQDGPVVALAYDSAGDTLLKAYADAVYQSGDGAQNWRRLPLPPLGEGRIAALSVSPASAGVMYVTGPGLGVLRTDDGGKTWVDRDEGLPKDDVVGIAAHTTQPDTVYAVVKEHGLYRSQDAGKTWRLMDRGPSEGIEQLTHSNMAGSMQTGWLFAATPKGVRRIMDCFCVWQDAGKLASRALSVTYDPKQPEHLVTATEKGLFRSMDGGQNWTHIASPSSKVVALTFANSGVLYAINADGDLFRSADQGNSWAQVNA
jgi:photosystem II stability/assembly factor-like uncharacterized protein